MDDDKHQQVNITGCMVQVLTSATSASQAVNSPNGQAPQPAPVDKAEELGEYHHFFTHNTVMVHKLIRQARQRIVFHAAFYPKYGDYEQGQYVKQAMARHDELELTAIFTDIDHVEWSDEFIHILRPDWSREDFVVSLEKSKKYFLNWKAIWKDRVHIYDTRRLPMFPVILIDDTLVIGHYAHSGLIAPQGLWMTIKHPCIPSLYDRLLKGEKPYEKKGDNDEELSDEETAIVRYLEELILG